MGLYGSPSMLPLGHPAAVAPPLRRRRHSLPVRVILWAVAVILVCAAAFCVLVTVAAVHGVATMPPPPPPMTFNP